MKTLAVYHLKGGVGKTTTCVNLGWAAAAAGERVLVWDLDPQGAASFCFRVKPKIKGGFRGLMRAEPELAGRIKGTDYPNLDILPADQSNRHMDVLLNQKKNPAKRMRELFAEFEDDYDWLLIDCPPSLSITSEALFEAVQALVLPTIPTPLALNSYKQVVTFIARHTDKPPLLLPFFSMVDLRKRLHLQTIDQALFMRRNEHGFIDIIIPYSADVERLSQVRSPLGVSCPKSPVVEAYRDLWREISVRMIRARRR